MLLYSASAELLETVCCFFDFQETSDSPNLTTYPVIDLLVLGQAAQSESHQHDNSFAGLDYSHMPWPTVPLRYLITLIAASQCDLLGACINWLKTCIA